MDKYRTKVKEQKHEEKKEEEDENGVKIKFPTVLSPLGKDFDRTIDTVNQDTGMQRFLGRVYGTTGVSIAATLAGAQLLSYSDLALAFGPNLFGGMALVFGGIGGMMLTKYRVVSDKDGLRAENIPARIASYSALVAGMTLTASPMVGICNEIDPMIMPIATGASLFTMGGASLYAYMKPTDSLLTWKAPLMGGLFGLVGVSLSALVGGMIFGHQQLAVQLLHNVDLYGGVGLFSALTAYDTHRAIQVYKDKDPDHLGVATDFYLDFVNLWIRFMEIVAKSRR